MIEWLWQQACISSLIICIILLLKPLVIKHTGAVSYYFLWAFLPAYICSSFIVPELFSLESARLTSYLITAKSQQAAINYSLAPFSSILFSIWVSGLLILASWMGVSHWRMTRSLQLKNQPSDIKLTCKNTPVRVVSSAMVSAPFITRTSEYTIVVPEHFSELDDTARKLIIRHELVHLARGDLWWNILAQSCALIFWFNPISWIGYREFRHAQELSCDAIVLKSHRRKHQFHYANALLMFAANAPRSMLTSLPYSSKEQLKERIMNLNSPINRTSLVAVMAITLLTITGTLQALELGKDRSVQKEPLYRTNPVYPAQAIKQNIEGAVTLKFDIQADGSVSNINVVGTAPKGLFDQAAIDAVSHWQYHKGAPLNDVLVEIVFALEDKAVERDEESHEVVKAVMRN